LGNVADPLAGVHCSRCALDSHSAAALTDDEVFEHFATVARESRLPLCIEARDLAGADHLLPTVQAER
jgi:dihydrodipicolinate synthase/N-acetylneuraminate lyase